MGLFSWLFDGTPKNEFGEVVDSREAQPMSSCGACGHVHIGKEFAYAKKCYECGFLMDGSDLATEISPTRYVKVFPCEYQRYDGKYWVKPDMVYPVCEWGDKYLIIWKPLSDKWHKSVAYNPSMFIEVDASGNPINSAEGVLYSLVKKYHGVGRIMNRKGVVLRVNRVHVNNERVAFATCRVEQHPGPTAKGTEVMITLEELEAYGYNKMNFHKFIHGDLNPMAT